MYEKARDKVLKKDILYISHHRDIVKGQYWTEVIVLLVILVLEYTHYVSDSINFAGEYYMRRQEIRYLIRIFCVYHIIGILL